MDNSGYQSDTLNTVNGAEQFINDTSNTPTGNSSKWKSKFVKEDHIVGPVEAVKNTGNSDIQRPQIDNDAIVTQADFEEKFPANARNSSTLKEAINRKLTKCKCSTLCIKHFVFSVLPCINIIRHYNLRRDLTGDIVGGLTVGIMHIPQGMAYAMLATLPPVYGLYTSFFPVIVYFLFGSSKHISLGTASVPCLMIGTAISKGLDGLSKSEVIPSLSNATWNAIKINTDNLSETTTTTTKSISTADDTSEMSPEELDLRLQFAMSVTFMVGVIQLLMSVFRLGFITVYMSDALIGGFTTGVTCHVFTSQVKHIFNVKLKSYSGIFKLIYTYRDFFTNISTTNYVTVLLSVSSITVLYCVSKFINRNPKLQPKMFMPVPVELIVVIIGTVVSYFLNLSDSYNVAVVSDIPTGLPMANTNGLKRLSWTLLTDAFPIVIVIFSISISIAKSLAKKHNYEVNANQELLAFGMASIASSFMSSVAPMAALSRAVVGDKVGVKSQVAGLVSCSLLLVVLYVIGPYFKTTPKCVLASVIVVSLQAMFLQILDLKKIYRLSKIDFIVWIVTFVCTILLDVDLGLLVAIGVNLATVIYRIQRPTFTVLGQLPGTHVLRDASVYREAMEIQGIKVLRYEHSLFFLNKEHFRAYLYKCVGKPSKIAYNRMIRDKILQNNMAVLPNTQIDTIIETQYNTGVKNKCQHDLGLHTVILDFSCVNFIDSSGVNVLGDIISEYRLANIVILLANCKELVLTTFNKTKFYTTLDRSNIFLTLDDAVKEILTNKTQSVRF
ncbi:prestin-like [Ruditapes philippinarum]|uniref:prestin-like n=1 Tax=Ruditapes philippinarum TaxID=129788 RepID=UPI00295AEFD4|nr:prestin-like [Ruditapes philippinarum]